MMQLAPGKHSLLLYHSFPPSFIQVCFGPLGPAGAKERTGPTVCGVGRGRGGRRKQSIAHLPSLITTSRSSSGTSSGAVDSHLSPRSHPPSLWWGEVPPPFLTRPALNQPLVFLSPELWPQDKAVSRFSMTRGRPVPSGALSGRGEIAKDGGREESASFLCSFFPALRLRLWLALCGPWTFHNRNWGLWAPLSSNLSRTRALWPDLYCALALTFMGL